jgi:hypothetical protein
VKFWDASAIVPLLVAEESTRFFCRRRLRAAVIRWPRNHRSREFHSIATKTIGINELRMKGPDKSTVGYAERLHHRREFEKIHTFHERYLLAPSEKPLSPAMRGFSCTADFTRHRSVSS